MKLIRRVGIRLKREQKKAMILVAAFFAISLLILSATTFSRGVNAQLKKLREQFFACLTIERTISGNTIVSPEVAEAAVIAAEPAGWTGSNVCYLSMENISLVPGKFTPEKNAAARIAKLISCRDSSLAREFSGEVFRLKEGRHLTAEDEKKVIISENLAEMNGVSVGDKIQSVVTDDIAIAAKQGIGTGYEYEIVGIFSIEESKQGESTDRAECEMYENCMFIDEKSGFEILENIRLIERQYLNGLTLWASDPADLYEMCNNVMAVSGYDWDTYFINTNAAEYEKSAEPMMRMEKIIGIFMLVVLLIAVLILVVLLNMWNYERIHEMAILLSIGCSKRNVFAQLFLENFILFVIGYVISIPVMQILVVFVKHLISYQRIGISQDRFFAVGVVGGILVVVVTLMSSLKILGKSPKELLSVQS